MGLKPRFSKIDIQKAIEAQKKNIENAIISRLEMVGWEFVKMAREKTAAQGGFNDQTGNLRSSIGFIVLKNGEPITENFEASLKGTDKQGGIKKGKKYIKELSPEFSNGFALIVVAGMEYAAAVENRLHKDVITGSSLIAETNLRNAMARLKEKIGRL